MVTCEDMTCISNCDCCYHRCNSTTWSGSTSSTACDKDVVASSYDTTTPHNIPIEEDHSEIPIFEKPTIYPKLKNIITLSYKDKSMVAKVKVNKQLTLMNIITRIQ